MHIIRKLTYCALAALLCFGLSANAAAPVPQPFVFPLSARLEPVALPLYCSSEEIRMITSVVMHEVGHCSRASKIAVTNVILNRLEDGRFGDSIEEILYSQGQFDAIHNYTNQEIPPDDACKDAVRDALMGEDNAEGAIYYCNPAFVYDDAAREWFQTLDLLFELDDQLYYK